MAVAIPDCTPVLEGRGMMTVPYHISVIYGLLNFSFMVSKINFKPPLPLVNSGAHLAIAVPDCTPVRDREMGRITP